MQHLPKQSTSSCGIKKRNAALSEEINIELWYQKAKCSTFRRNQHRVVVLKSEVQHFLKKSASSCGIKNQNAALSGEVSIKLWYQKAKCSTYQSSQHRVVVSKTEMQHLPKESYQVVASTQSALITPNRISPFKPRGICRKIQKSPFKSMNLTIY
jgi:predicted GIY-YIG superfamily endonuclease